MIKKYEPFCFKQNIHHRSSSEIYATLELSSLKGVPLASCIGDQQAALVGQNCFRPGQVYTF